jgi:hypothetical protein
VSARREPPAAGGYPVDSVAFALGALVLVAAIAPRVAGFTTDSDAYLDVAANLAAGRGLVQRVVDFWRPGLPDPLGMWPPLYPALVALVGAAGVPLESAARLVSAASFVAFAGAFHALSARALARGPAALVAAFSLSLAGVALLGAHAWSEPTFLALVAGAMVLLAGRGSGIALDARRAALAGLLLGLAALTRHAGIVVAFAAVAGSLRTPTLRGARVPFAVLALAPGAAWMIRNLLLFGRPFGPALPAAQLDAGSQAFVLARALRWEFLPAPFDAGGAGALVLAAVLGTGVALAVRDGGVGRVAAGLAGLQLALVLVAVSTRAINAPAGRYLAPALPFLALAAIAGLAGRRSGATVRTLAAGLAGVLALAAAVELAGWFGAHPPSPPEVLARRADRAALGRLVPAGEAPVLSDAGHLVRLASGRPAVQVPPPAFRARDYGSADDARWARAGVNEAVLTGPSPPPAGAWARAASAGRFTRWVRR